MGRTWCETLPVLPPLRDRREDVFVLLMHYMRAFSESHQLPVPEISAEALTYLSQYHWPGNVRELRNLAERLVLRAPDRVEVEALPSEILRSTRQPAPDPRRAPPE